ncbi:DNA polymerase III subunit beta [Coriobacteriia bacterium Es71-Z0120]|uniref:DNA polymerase III subunit beta n=1 Tax=Parvivirga hydrogeniphila TaxID=2939460 RepID=UPI00226094A8|nr:DNA polymerase III subunit beta [Parvivirga hydrogeniphila]MCL4078191.1 DNA polymerase III subunit beta [Parvivirga hydrogeniphila]
MKVSLARTELADALFIINRGLSSRTTLPILSGVLLTAKGDDLVLNSTDLDVSVKTGVKARVDEAGSTVVPGRLFGDIIRSLPEGAVSVETEGTSVRVVSGTSSFTLKTLSPDEFPRFPEVDSENEVTLEVGLFTTMVQKVARAVSKDETRPVLTGALVEVSDGNVTMVSTDSYRLCLAEASGQNESRQFSAVIPGRALDDVSKLVAGSEGVTIASAQNQIVFVFGGTTFVTRRIEGVFPNYKQLLPSEYETRVTVNKEEMLSAVRRVSLMAQHSAPVRVTVSPEERTLVLSAQTHDVGDATEVVEADVEGQPVEMAFNHAYLTDGITGADSEKITLDIVSPMKPGVIRAGEDISYTYLLMPVRLG